MASMDVYLRPGASRTHPPGYDRLGQILCQFVDESDFEESEGVWSFVQLALYLHIENRGLRYDPSRLDATSFKEIADYLIDVISKA